MKHDIMIALDYFKCETSATAIFIRIQDRVAYSIEDNSKTHYGFIPAFELDELVGRLGVCHQIQIISQRDSNGNYVLPDIDMLEFEKELDY